MSSTSSRCSIINCYILNNKKLLGSLALVGIGATIVYKLYNDSSDKKKKSQKPTSNLESKEKDASKPKIKVEIPKETIKAESSKNEVKIDIETKESDINQSNNAAVKKEDDSQSEIPVKELSASDSEVNKSNNAAVKQEDDSQTEIPVIELPASGTVSPVLSDNGFERVYLPKPTTDTDAILDENVENCSMTSSSYEKPDVNNLE